MGLKLMDVTLRESIYVPEANLTKDHAIQLVQGLSEMDIDYIEIGYVQLEKKNNYLPYYCPMDYINELSNAIVPGSKSKLVVMLHPDHYSPELLERMKHPSIGLVRLCIPLSKADSSMDLIKILKNNEINVSANLIRASHATEKEILDFSFKSQEAGADIVYLADSNGALIPKKVKELYSMLCKNLNIELGFHPHNNLHLASTNALEAIDEGASLIDVSLFGFGKGLTNLCLESFMAILHRVGILENKDIGKLIQISKKAHENFIHNLNNDTYMIEEKNILVGYHNINLDVLDGLERKAKEFNISILDCLLNLNNNILTDSIEECMA